MRWNWQQPDWPRFTWDPDVLRKAEIAFLRSTGVLLGSVIHLDQKAQQNLLVEAMSTEAMTTSEIEGEILNRASVQSSIQKQLGLAGEARKIPHAERGIAELMVSLYQATNEPLNDQMLFRWHTMVVAGRTDLRDVARYRTNPEPMQIVSGASYAPKMHFEAPPTTVVANEMGRFLEWFNRTAAGAKEALPAVTRAGIAHLYFETIHPFEDGNGRVGRAIAEKALVEGLEQPTIVGLARSILAHHKDYYLALEAANKKNEITDWLRWFAGIAIEAQHRTLASIEFVIAKTRLLDGLKGRINDRQQKVVDRMLREGPEGFAGGMSANKYSAITGTPPATTTRDLAGLVEAGAFVREGELRHTRYRLNIPVTPARSVTIDRHGDIL